MKKIGNKRFVCSHTSSLCYPIILWFKIRKHTSHATEHKQTIIFLYFLTLFHNTHTQYSFPSVTWPRIFTQTLAVVNYIYSNYDQLLFQSFWQSNVLSKEVEDQLVHLLRWLLLNKVSPFWQNYDIQIGDKLFNLSTVYVVYNSWKFVDIIFAAHYEKCWLFNYRICYVSLFSKRSAMNKAKRKIIMKDLIRSLKEKKKECDFL